METFGSYLKTQREKKGIRLEEIASITKIHLHSLELLETGKWKRLPPEPFIRGFIIAYAKYVGLEPKEAVDKYLAEVNPQELANETLAPVTAEMTRPARPQPKKSQPILGPAAEVNAAKTPHDASDHSEPNRPNRTGIAALGVGLALALAIFVITKRSPPGDSPAPEVTAVNAPAEAPVAPTNVAVAPVEPLRPANPAPEAGAQTPTPVPIENRAPASPNEKASEATPDAVSPKTEAAHEVVIEGKDRSWIKVVVDDQAPLEFFLKEGQKITYKANNKIKVVLGNSAGSKVTHNGEVSPGVKFQGTIRSYIFPADARFPQDIPKRAAPTSDSTQFQPDQG